MAAGDTQAANNRVYLNTQFHDAIDDFRWLAEDIISRPTRLAEVVPEAPTLVGTVDASGAGMGGVWLPDGDALYAAALDPDSLAVARDYRRGDAVGQAMATRDRAYASRCRSPDAHASARPGISRTAGDPEDGGYRGSTAGLGRKLPQPDSREAGRPESWGPSTHQQELAEHAGPPGNQGLVEQAGLPDSRGMAAQAGFPERQDDQLDSRGMAAQAGFPENQDDRLDSRGVAAQAGFPERQDDQLDSRGMAAQAGFPESQDDRLDSRGMAAQAGFPESQDDQLESRGMAAHAGFPASQGLAERAGHVGSQELAEPAGSPEGPGRAEHAGLRAGPGPMAQDQLVVPKLVRPSLRDRRPILWRQQFPDDIVAALVSEANPSGTINNSELELAGIVATNDVLARESDIRETTTATGTDNLPALSWSTKGAVSAKGPAAYLLRHQAMHQRLFRYQSRPFYVPGESNGMADDCSRLWHLSDEELVAYFDATYPQPKPWRICRLAPGTATALFSALRCERQPLPEILGGVAGEPTRMPKGQRSSSGTLRTRPPSGRPVSYRPGRGSWRLEASPSAHGLRKRLFDSLGKRCTSWASGTTGLTLDPQDRRSSRARSAMINPDHIYA